MAQKLLEPERVAASLDVQLGVGVPEQMDGRFLDASLVIVGPHCIPQCADGQLYAILRYEQQVRGSTIPIYQVLFQNFGQCPGKRDDLLISGLHVAEEHRPIGEVDILDFQVDQRGRTAPGPQQKVDYDPIAVLGKGAGFLVRRFKQALQFVAGVSFFDGIVCPYQLDGKALQIPFVHAPIQERTNHAEISVDGRIVELLLF